MPTVRFLSAYDVRFLAEKPHEEGYGQRPRVVERAEFRGFRQMKN